MRYNPGLADLRALQLPRRFALRILNTWKWIQKHLLNNLNLPDIVFSIFPIKNSDYMKPLNGKVI